MLPFSLLAVGSSSLACPWNPTVDPPVRHLTQVSIAQATTKTHLHNFLRTKKPRLKEQQEGGRWGWNLSRLNENSTVLSSVLCLMLAMVRRLTNVVKKQTPSSLYSSVHFLVVNQLVCWSVRHPLSLSHSSPFAHTLNEFSFFLFFSSRNARQGLKRQGDTHCFH